MRSQKSITVVAPAKVNLYLHITGRLDNGYHLLDSLVAFAGIHDTLNFAPADDLHLSIDGPFGPELDAGVDNLVLRAARGLASLSRDKAGASKGAHITLTKRLPLAAGIGGGSADAAATLKGLARLWNIQPDQRQMQELALSLGADVPVCLHARGAFIGGIGEDITSAPPLPAGWLVLVNPGVQLSTPAVFKGWGDLGGQYSQPGQFDYGPTDLAELVAIVQTRGNDLATAAIHMAPVIGHVLDALEACDGALMARMSGSGATCFGLFADPAKAAAATFKLAAQHAGWWIKTGSLEGDIRTITLVHERTVSEP